MNNEFAKSDLKTGMILEFKRGEKATVLLGTENGDIFAGETWGPINGLTDDLMDIENEERGKVAKVYQPVANCYYINTKYIGGDTRDYKLLWEREETKEMTIEEIQKELGYKIKIIE